MKRVRTVAVIPAFNEEKRVGAVVRGAKRYVDAVLVIDDGSSDRSAEAAQKAGALVLRLPENMGAGYATRKGIEHAISRLRAGRVVLLDADGQHPAERIPDLLAKLDGGRDIVFTARRFDGQMPLLKRLGNWGLTLATNLLTGVKVADSQSGFKAMTADAFRRMRLRSERYEICSEVVFEAGRRKLKYSEVPIRTTYGPPKKGTTVFDGVMIFARMLRMKAARG